MQIIDDPRYPKTDLNNQVGYTVRYLFINKQGIHKKLAAMMWGSQAKAEKMAEYLIANGKQEVEIYRGYFGGFLL